MTRLLVATDFSADAQFAVDRAGQLARAWNAELDLLHVPSHGMWPQGTGMLSKYLGSGNLASLQEDEQRLATLAAALSRRFRIKPAVHVVPGRPAAEIAAFATAREADLVVLAVRGQGRTRAGSVGGTALKVLWQSLMPVLLVRTPAETVYRRLLLATDLSERSIESGRRVTALWPKAGLSVVHAFRGEYETALELAGARPAMIREYRADQAQLAADGLAGYWKQVRGDSRRRAAEFLVQGHPVPGVLKAAGELKPDLVVLGKHAGPRWEERIVGSVAQNLVQQLKTDILMVA